MIYKLSLLMIGSSSESKEIWLQDFPPTHIPI